MTAGAKAAFWLIGAVIIVLLLDYEPRLGGALLLLLVAYLATEVTRKGVV